MTKDEYKELSKLLRDAKESGKLNPWQESFVRSFAKRVEEYKEQTYVSYKQFAALRDIQITLYESDSLEIT